jgi:hypothetical protein
MAGDQRSTTQCCVGYPLSTLATWTLIIYYFQKMLKIFKKIISSKSEKIIVKENNGYLRIFHLLKMNVSKLINYSMDMC